MTSTLRPRRMRSPGVFGLAAIVTTLAGCTVDDTATATVGTPGGAIVATVDCGDDGVATVRSSFGPHRSQDVLVTRAPAYVSDVSVRTYSDSFRIDGDMSDSEVIITTTPSRGVCTMKLIDDETDRVMIESTGPAPETVSGTVTAAR